jgi:ABC-type polar amino acid transport system ATPase subunit
MPDCAKSYPLLQLCGLRKTFADREILKGVELHVHQGQVVSLIGASGSGKTTLLRCINLLEEHDSGQILLNGEQIGFVCDERGRRRLSERLICAQRARIGMVFQRFNLFPHLTAEENITLGLTKVLGRSKPEARETAGAWLARVGLAAYRTRYPHELSGGQQQRVAIARAVAMQPRLLLLDEVTSALDPELVDEVLNVLNDLAKSGMTMLVVSHEMAFVRDVCSQVVFLDAGRVLESGPPSCILSSPTTERLRMFLGRFHRELHR